MTTGGKTLSPVQHRKLGLPIIAVVSHRELWADENNLAIQQKHPAVEAHSPARPQPFDTRA